VPAELRADQAAVQRYAGGLIGVAQFFATQLGDPALMEAISGPPDTNPVATWQRALGQARRLMDEARYGEARQLLSGAAADARGMTGPAVDRYLPITYGMLGECGFQLGDAAAALDPTGAALRLCEQHGDRAGVAAYLGSLFEIHRYLGQAAPAADAAERYAATLAAAGESQQADSWRRQARLVRAGEPLNRVVAVIDDDRHELGDVPRLGNQRVQFVFQRNRITLEPSRRHTAAGERFGGEGRHAEAHAAFQEAARCDPFDPQPRYLSGLALLHLRRYADAVAEYEATERLAPGWFNCRADLWLARELARGALDPSLHRVLYLLEDAPLPPAEKVRMAGSALRTAPGLAPLHLFHGLSVQALGGPAETSYRNGLACAAEPDIRSRLLLSLAVVSSPSPARSALLAEAAALPGGNLIAAAMATLTLRASGS
jgi:tetratricopeptide (TPR) repeat protein